MLIIKDTFLYKFARYAWRRFKISAHKLYTPSMRRHYVEWQYQKAAHEKLDWDNLQTYNEKMQFEKLYHEDPRKTRLTDKLEVRAYVESLIGAEYLVPVISIGGGRYSGQIRTKLTFPLSPTLSY